MRAAWIVFRTELRALLRDRRALFVGWILPLLFYPLLFLGSEKLGRSSREALETRTITIGLGGGHAPAELLEELRGRLELELCEVASPALPNDWAALADEEREAAVRALLEDPDEALDALLWAPLAQVPVQLELWGDFADESGAEARKRVQRSLRDAEHERRLALYERHLGGDPAAGWTPELRDVATAGEQGGLALGRLLAFVSIVVLISGGSFAALDAFSAERERGTLETLLVHPVPALSIAWGKFALVALSAIGALVGSMLSFTLCVALELGSLPGLEGIAGQAPPVGRLLAGLAAILPTAVLVSAALCWTSARARSYREGQHALFPLTLVALVPAGWASAQTVELDFASAWIPIAGGALALRDVLRGNAAVGPLLLVLVSSTAWAAWVVGQLGKTLDAERLLASRDASSEGAARRIASRRALRWGWAAVGAVFLVGSRLQSLDPLWGLVATLWVLVPAMAWLAARDGARVSGTHWTGELGWRRPRVPHLVAAGLMAPALAWCTSRLIAWQNTVLPVPPEMLESLENALPALSLPALLLVAAISPGLTEEFLFRGAVLSGLRRDRSAWACIAWQALLFGAVHLSIHRFLPTAIAGALAAAVTLRARSIWPAVLLHSGYNATLVASTTVGTLGSATNAILENPWTPVLFLAGAGLWSRPR